MKKLLEDREWLQRSDRGICLIEPSKLPKNGRRTTVTARTRLGISTHDERPQIEANIATAWTTLGLDYALAGFSAASRLALSVRYQRAMAYVSDQIDEVAKRAGLKPVTSGPNVTLFEPYDEGVMAGSRDVDDIRITSPIQTYLTYGDSEGEAKRRRKPSCGRLSGPHGEFATDYTSEAVEAARSVMLELIRLLGEYRDDMVITGAGYRPSPACCGYKARWQH